MINIEDLWDVLTMVIYILEAFYFVFISKKCFFDKLPFHKGLGILLLSPVSAYWLTAFACENLLKNLESRQELLLYSAVSSMLVAAILIIFMVVYIWLVQAKNRSVSLFLYLCGSMLVPGIMMTFALQFPMRLLPIICTVGLSVAFYLMTVRPLSEISKERQVTNPRLFIALPVVVFVYKTTFLFFSTYALSMGLDALAKVLDFIRLMPPDDTGLKEAFRAVVKQYTSYDTLVPTMIYTSDVFIMSIMMAAFSLITRNIRYVNRANKAHEEIKALAVEMMEALAHTIDAKDAYTKGHSVRVAKYSRMIAVRMGLSEKECDDVYYYGLLHDLGKIGIPNEIINSTTKLTNAEYDVVKAHPVIGYDILSEVHSRPDLTIGARWHHERYDGKGYPDGKVGTDIPLLARIIAVADSYDAMTSNRSYRNYLPQDKVREEIVHNMGTQFDPEIARYMLNIIDEDVKYTLHE